MLKSLLRKEISIEWVIFILTLVWGAVYSVYIYSLGLTTIFVDQSSHLNIARLVTDSLTPGVSQLGFWPPLLHIVLAPFASVDFLFQSGLAGAVGLVPLLAVSAVLLYKLVLLLTNNKILGIGGVLMLVLNPYVLYYSATPMTELLFVFTLIGVAYFLVSFLKTLSFSSLVYLGIFVTLAGLARYEGFLLLPIVAFFIAAKLFVERRKYHEIEAYIILFGLISVIGLAFTFIYGIAFGSGPLEFMSGDWAAAAQQESFNLPTAGDLGLSILYLIEASKFMLSEFVVYFSVASFIFLILLAPKETKLLPIFAISAVFLSPFMFDILALYKGSAILYLDTLPPFDGYFNERYGLYWIGFAIVIPLLFIQVVNKHFKRLSPKFNNTIGIGLVAFFVLTNFIFLYTESVNTKYALYDFAQETTLPGDQTDAGLFLKDNYDGGKILITRALQNFIPPASGIPLKNYIHESNFEVYDQALLAPWMYAKWVVMYNDEIPGIEEWRAANERISNTWRDSEVFHKAYELVYKNQSERIYKLKEEEVLQVAYAYDMDPSTIPSLNDEIEDWDYAEYFWQIQDGVKNYQSKKIDRAADNAHRTTKDKSALNN